ncbi:histidine kinase/DNA gyrase B/HSP90-like ATPase [Bosea sp. AK1]|uniref:ATP-binding protein n=1 Tax=Bosea sp. AK1 TaxID=2587160 RepID=UPI001154D8C9|nr:ATP-binding protein [Bosea sp. AK1]TQI75330.1 histidine kinase/DNA gyrase B/HSP90-like ATPase [Bosea sp. AK1]
MIETASFQARARTVDHLGREQIADTPTAISELWKNSFDAYARSVSLEIYDGASPVAALLDDGHGMSKTEFIEKWLVIGTESKISGTPVPVEDRDGLPVRPKLGQKGIGRLSCANLGPLLLLVTKRRSSPFLAAILDWRLFENPFLNFSDIAVPHLELGDLSELWPILPGMIEALRSNVTGEGKDAARGQRVKAAWSAMDELHEAQARERGETPGQRPSLAILDALKTPAFSSRHLSTWTVAEGASVHGTAMLVGDINYDLIVQIHKPDGDATAKAARDKFFETLSSFVDPFVDPANASTIAKRPDFTYQVRSWIGDKPSQVVGLDKQFDRRMLDGMEHIIDGAVDANGVFRGRIKAFGVWQDGIVTIEPPLDVRLSRRPDSELGVFHVYIAAMEFARLNTTLPPAEFTRYEELAERYSGFMIFRDGLRVLPYGRTDNDFFEIEYRRSKHAGREFWNHRQMFGRIAITRDGNPNLKDKAGREGLLDNRAAKSLKQVVSHILQATARRYFGSDSSIRQENLPEIRAGNKGKKAAEERKKLQVRHGRKFRTMLKEQGVAVPALRRELDNFVVRMAISDEDDVLEAQKALESFRDRAADLKLPAKPRDLSGNLAERYIAYRDDMQAVQAALTDVATSLEREVERLNPKDPRALLLQQAERHGAQIRGRIQGWKRKIDALQKSEFDRLSKLYSERNKEYAAASTPVIARFDRGEIDYPTARRELDELKERHVDENSQVFEPYVAALENLSESIDLEHLASFGSDENRELRTELDRLNSLAQLGIAVEIAGHEMQDYEEMIGGGIRALPPEVAETRAVRDIAFGYEGLTDQLRFLTPLRLAGMRLQRWIAGAEIHEYLAKFFKLQLARGGVNLEATTAFSEMRTFDQPSRLMPVFINLVNNSIYWLGSRPAEDRRIILDIVGGDVVVSDNGPGVPPEDQESLFTLFFTRKSVGGRGVGLYLCKANLAAGGHRIRYVASPEGMPLSGANFAITFKGALQNGE